MTPEDRKKEENLGLILRGARYRATHCHSVQAILGPAKLVRPIVSHGTQFFNVDRWTGRFLVAHMCAWAKDHPGCVPGLSDVREWVTKANAEKVPNPHIVIAATPDELPIRLAMALTGGAYHEAWHTLYSCRRNLRVEEVANLVIPRWAKVPDWSKYQGLLLEFSNIVEDIRNERRGNEDYPGALIKMHDLQDFVLKQESDGRQEIRAHGGGQVGRPLTVICATYRDLGLGYNTVLQRQAIDDYRRVNPKAVDLVVSGPLSPILQENITLSADDDLGCIRLALDIVALLLDLGQAEEDKKNPPPPIGPGKTMCPNCAAPGNKLVLRPKARAASPGSVPNRALLTCTVCGWQQEIQVIHQDSPAKTPFTDGPSIQGFSPPVSPLPERPGGRGSGEVDQGTGSVRQGTKQTQDGEPAPGAGSKGDGDETTPSGNESVTNAGGGGTLPVKPTQKPRGDARGAGGHYHDPNNNHSNDFASVIRQALGEAEAGKGTGLLDNNSAFAAAIATLRDKEDQSLRRNEDGEVVEAPWRPFDPSLDEVRLVQPSTRPSGVALDAPITWGREYDQAQADLLLTSTKEEISFLRARLRNLVRAQEMTATAHGLRFGTTLSVPFLVDTRLALHARQEPTKAFCRKDEQIDTSLAAAIVLDQSSSMRPLLPLVTRVMCAITEPLDFLGCAVQVSGFRDGRNGLTRMGADLNASGGPYHRFEGVTHDVFKTFAERFYGIRWRFSRTRSVGGTPMADGIQFGLDSLSLRREGHRVLFVITDGKPSPGHEPIMRRQFRLASDAGIWVIGVGLGPLSISVLRLFYDSVWTKNIQDMPRALATKLNTILDPITPKRGRRVRRGG